MDVGPAGNVRVAVALADIQELRQPAPSPRREPDKFPVRRVVTQSLLIGLAGCVALMLSFAVFGM
jgi:hypothetical protein